MVNIRHIKAFVFILAIGLLWYGCRPSHTTEDFEPSYGYDFFPLEVGQYRLYRVDSVIFHKDQAPDTVSGFARETVVEKLTTGTDTTRYRILRQWRRADDDTWRTDAVWWASRTALKAVQTENNLSFVKLVFPLKVGEKWDGNAGFPAAETEVQIGDEHVAFYKAWAYRVERIGQEVISPFGLLETADVVEADFETLIELRQSTAKYARGIGLVERHQRILDTQCITCDGPWEEKAEAGVILDQVLIEHN